MEKTQKVILLIEDDPDQQKMYAFALTQSGNTVLQAFTGQEGIAMAQKEKIDVILLDLLLGEMDGIEVLRQLKKEPKTASIPVVILTNYTKEETLNEALSLGAAEIVIKTDVIPKQLVHLLEHKYLA